MGDRSRARNRAGLWVLAAGAISVAPAIVLLVGHGDPDRTVDAIVPASTEDPAQPQVDAELEAPDLRDPVASRSFGGEIRIGSPSDYVRFRRNGVLRVQDARGADQATVDVLDGRFQFESEGELPLLALELQSGPWTAKILSGSELVEGRHNVIHAVWGPRTVLVSAFDEQSLAPLGNVQVWRTLDATTADQDPMWGGSTAPGPDDSDPLVVPGAASPFQLEIPAGSAGGYWIASPDHVPFRYGFPNGVPHDRLSVVLQRAARIEVVVDGLPADARAAPVRLGRLLQGEDPVASDAVWLLQRDVEGSTTFEGLAAGAYRVQLLSGGGTSASALDEASFELESAEHRTVVLDPTSGNDAQSTCSVTFEFPYLTAVASQELTARIVPRLTRRSDARLPPESAITPGGTWGPLDLPAGDYSLVLSPGRIALRFSAEAGGHRQWVVPAFPTTEVRLTLLSGADGTPLSLYGLTWFAPMDFEGSFDPAPWFDPPPAPLRENPVAVACPASRLRLRGNAIGLGEFRAEVDPLGGEGGVVVVPPAACLDIRLAGLDDEVTHDWLWRTRISSGKTVLRPRSIVIDHRADGPRGLIYLDAEGHLELEFPPLPSHGSIEPVHVEVSAGQTLELILDPTRLWKFATGR